MPKRANMTTKYMPIREFREAGFLQELNRQFLHPLGLALEVTVDDETGEERLGGIWDYRDDPHGMIYDLANPEFSSEDRIQRFRERAVTIAQMWMDKKSLRMKKFGFMIEPIPTKHPLNEVSADNTG